MAKLTDTQSILLAHAAKQEDGSIYPLPASLIEDGNPSDRAVKAVGQLLGRGLAVERETNTAASTCRVEGDLSYGMFITSIGLTAIGIDDSAGDNAPPASPPAASATPSRQTKASAVLALLQREEGATLAELVDATGWLPHTTRAALTGLRKKGHAIGKSKRGEVTCYKVAA